MPQPQPASQAKQWEMLRSRMNTDVLIDGLGDKTLNDKQLTYGGTVPNWLNNTESKCQIYLEPVLLDVANCYKCILVSCFCASVSPIPPSEVDDGQQSKQQQASGNQNQIYQKIFLGLDAYSFSVVDQSNNERRTIFPYILMNIF